MAICHLSHLHLFPTTFFLTPKPLHPPATLRITEISAVRRYASVRSSQKSSDKVRNSRNRKSDEEICDELREFISLAGLPIKRMPSLKVLSDNGRKDLAKVIKSRGYKSFSNLFLSSVTNDEVKENLSDDMEDEDAYKEEERYRRIEDVAPSNEFVDEDAYEEGDYRIEGVAPLNEFLGEDAYDVGDYRIEGVDPSGEFPDMDQVEWHGLVNNGTYTNETVEASFVAEQTNDTDEAQFIGRIDCSTNGIVNGEEKPIPSLVSDYSTHEIANFEESSVLSVVNEPGSYVAINNLKALLDKKDIELSKLKQKIEEEKIELLKLQEKAKARIANVEVTIRDNCCVIQDVEDKLKGLKEVPIEFMANAKVVEIAGSFNGWQHRLKMNLDQSSNSEDPSNYREPTVWSIVLLLYPGVYQIKFVVDGNWRVDPKRELVTTDDFANNVLRVEN